MGQKLNSGATPTTQQDWHFLSAWHGGTIHALALSPNFAEDGSVLAATAVGLFHSFDSGQYWRRIGDGIDDPSILALAFASAQIAFASSAQGRLYRSADGGYSWQVIDAWSGLGVISAIAISPNYAQDHSLFVATSEGIFRSLNDGVEWQEASFGLLDLDVLCLLCAPDFAESETLWAGTALGGLFRSRNAGRAWREAGDGLPDCAIQTLALSPNYRQDRTLFVGSESDGVYVSHDGGLSWQPSGQDLAGMSVNALACTFLDTDQKDKHEPETQNQRSSAFISVQKVVVVAATSTGLFRSEDSGDSWQACGGDPVLALDLKLATNGVGLAADYQAGIVHSQDGGQRWQVIDTALSAHAPPLVAATAQGDLYALDETGALAWSAKGRTTWQAVTVPPLEEPLIALAVRNETIYVAASTSLHAYQPQNQQWQPIALVGENLHLLAVGPGESLLVAEPAGLLHLSLDAGATWQQRAMPWLQPTTTLAAETLLQVLFSPLFAEDQLLYAVSVQKNPTAHFALSVWQSVDQGQHWETLASFESGVPSVLAALPVDPNQHALFLATQHRLIKLFNNGELAVEQFFFGEDDAITALAVSPNYATNHTLLVATRSSLHRSTDGGTSWQMVAGELERPVVALFPQLATSRIIAITLGGDVWELRP